MSKAPPLKPVLIVGLSIAAFLAVMNFAILPEGKKNTIRTNTDASTSLANSNDSNVNDTDANNTNTSEPANTNTSTNSSYFQITEWGVEFPKSEGISFLYTMDSDMTMARFSTTVLNNDANCKTSDSPIGVVSRYTSRPTEGPLSNSTPVVIDGWNYYFTSPQATCSDDEAIVNLQIQAITALRINVANLRKSTSTDPTAGWKTYTNDEFGFTIQYPPTWTSRSPAYTGASASTGTSQHVLGLSAGPFNGDWGILLTVNPGSINTTLSDNEYYWFQNWTILERTPTTVNDYGAEEVTWSNFAAILYVQKPNGALNVQFDGILDSTSSEVAQVLSTFAFTN